MNANDPIRSKIRELRGYLRRLVTLDGGARALAVAVASVTAAVLLDWLLDLPPALRAVLLAAAVVLTGYVVTRFLARPLARMMSDEDLAESVERRHPGFRDALISTVEFTRENQEKSYFGSRSEERRGG